MNLSLSLLSCLIRKIEIYTAVMSLSIKNFHKTGAKKKKKNKKNHKNNTLMGFY